jgi:hypothetical protein
VASGAERKPLTYGKVAQRKYETSVLEFYTNIIKSMHSKFMTMSEGNFTRCHMLHAGGMADKAVEGTHASPYVQKLRGKG